MSSSLDKTDGSSRKLWRAHTPGRQKRIVVLGTGGSISTLGRSPFDLVDYGEFGQLVSTEQLFAMFPELGELAEFEFIEATSVHSEALTTDHWSKLARVLETQAQRSEVDGIVVVHGTSTLEEAAWFLHLTVRSTIPIVITGAMRPANGLSTDAGLNLACAISAACYRPLAEYGVLAVIDGEIHGARDVTKVSTYQLSAFRSGELGPVGFVDALGAVSLYRAPWGTQQHFSVTDAFTLPRVDVVCSYSGADGAAVNVFIEAGATGIVVASMAPGVCPPSQLRALENAAQNGAAIVFSSRAGQGRVLKSEFLKSRGFFTADNLTPQKARILLRLALSSRLAPDDIQRSFDHP